MCDKAHTAAPNVIGSTGAPCSRGRPGARVPDAAATAQALWASLFQVSTTVSGFSEIDSMPWATNH